MQRRKLLRCACCSLLLDTTLDPADDAHIVSGDQLQHACCALEWLQRAVEAIHSKVQHLQACQGEQSALLEIGNPNDSSSAVEVIMHNLGTAQSAAIS